jgi:hypothetical protein
MPTNACCDPHLLDIAIEVIDVRMLWPLATQERPAVVDLDAEKTLGDHERRIGDRVSITAIGNGVGCPLPVQNAKTEATIQHCGYP